MDERNKNQTASISLKCQCLAWPSIRPTTRKHPLSLGYQCLALLIVHISNIIAPPCNLIVLPCQASARPGQPSAASWPCASPSTRAWACHTLTVHLHNVPFVPSRHHAGRAARKAQYEQMVKAPAAALCISTYRQRDGNVGVCVGMVGVGVACVGSYCLTWILRTKRQNSRCYF